MARNPKLFVKVVRCAAAYALTMMDVQTKAMSQTSRDEPKAVILLQSIEGIVWNPDHDN
jgi:hypothetical protein